MLPISPSHSQDDNTISSLRRNHSMTTRLQFGAIPKKVYSAYVSILPKLQSLQLNDDDVNYGGFSFLDDIMDS